jgi:hypothetical protein
MRKGLIISAAVLALVVVCGQPAAAAGPAGPGSKAGQVMLNPQPEPPGVVGDQAKLCKSVNGQAIKCAGALPPGPCKAAKGKVACKALPPGPCRAASSPAVDCKPTTNTTAKP